MELYLNKDALQLLYLNKAPCTGHKENPPLFGKCINGRGDDKWMNIMPIWNYFFRRWITLIA